MERFHLKYCINLAIRTLNSLGIDGGVQRWNDDVAGQHDAFIWNKTIDLELNIKLIADTP